MPKYLHIQAAQNHMATTFDFVISCEENRAMAANQVLQEAHKSVARLETELSEFLEISPIAVLNRSPVGVWVPQSKAGLELFEQSERLRLLSDSAFSCTAKSKDSEGTQVTWDLDKLSAARLTEGALVSFGAIGKGYAIDQVRLLLEQEGFYNYFLTAGGSSLVLSGFSSQEQPWRWGWSWSHSVAGDALGIALRHTSGEPIAIGVSGRHEKGNHLIDPRSGNPIVHGKSALVASQSATEADALSTALFVGGWDDSVHRFASLSPKPAIAVIEEDEVPRWNGIFQNLWGTLACFIACFSFCMPVLAGDTSVDLNELGVEDFTPYIFDRNYWWMALPAFMLAVIALHLKNSRPKAQLPNIPLEDLNETNINQNDDQQPFIDPS